LLEERRRRRGEEVGGRRKVRDWGAADGVGLREELGEDKQLRTGVSVVEQEEPVGRGTGQKVEERIAAIG
jgi:hypothetical protein